MHGIPWLLGVLLLFASHGDAAACGDQPGDAAAVAAARAEVDATCDCLGAARRSVFVACARGVANSRVEVSALRPACANAVVRCASRSTCGRPGAVTCCVPRPHGVICRVVRGAAACTARGGTPGTCPSCCDACGGSCPGPTTTTTTATTTTTTTTTFVSVRPCGSFVDLCLGECPPETPICAGAGGICQCIAGTTPCGPLGALACDGVCPPGQMCFPGGVNTCGCIPSDSVPCATSEFPTCGGTCPDGQGCVTIDMPDVRGCFCPPLTCGAHPACSEDCPGDATCEGFTLPGIALCLCQD